MGWKFWKTEPEKSEAELQLEGLQSGAATPPPPAAPRATPGTSGTSAGYGADAFQLTVEDVFTITGRGTVVTGRVSAGTVSEGMEVTLTTPEGTSVSSRVIGIEAFRKRLAAASAGEHVGLLLDRVPRDRVPQGTVVTG